MPLLLRILHMALKHKAWHLQSLKALRKGVIQQLNHQGAVLDCGEKNK